MPIEEQQRLQQYNHMLPGRNVQSPNMSSGSLSGSDRGVRILPGGNTVGMVAGMSRSMPMSRPGLQGIPSSSMLNSGSMLSSNMGGIPNNMNMHSGTASGQGNLFRPRDALHMVRVRLCFLFPSLFSSAVVLFYELQHSIKGRTAYIVYSNL